MQLGFHEFATKHSISFGGGGVHGRVGEGNMGHSGGGFPTLDAEFSC